MASNFEFYSPTRVIFGKGTEQRVGALVREYGGTRVLIVYGGKSAVRSGVLDRAENSLAEAGISSWTLGGVVPNPHLDKVYEGIRIGKENSIDFLLAVGGGSVCDYTKAVAASVHCEEDPWQKYFVRFEEPACPVVPLGCVLTMVGTGSEMNAGSVITNPDTKEKVGKVFENEDVMPKFSILDPNYTLTLPRYQMVSGIYDIFNHICEQYFCGADDNTSDYLSEGLMRSVIHSSRIAVKNPQDYEARSNLMWTATWALNTLVECGKSGDWMVHMLGQAVGGVTNATHGMTLAAVSQAYYHHVLPYGLPKFKRFAEAVWGIDPAGKTEEEVALAGLDAMKAWMEEIGVVLHLTELGVDESMLDQIADLTFHMDGGYKALKRDEILAIFRESL